jgi:hypothetical protein
MLGKIGGDDYLNLKFIDQNNEFTVVWFIPDK